MAIWLWKELFCQKYQHPREVKDRQSRFFRFHILCRVRVRVLFPGDKRVEAIRDLEDVEQAIAIVIVVEEALAQVAVHVEVGQRAGHDRPEAGRAGREVERASAEADRLGLPDRDPGLAIRALEAGGARLASPVR